VIVADIRDPVRLKDAVMDKDVLFDYAAQVSHVRSMSDPYLDIDINCRGTMNLLESLRKHNDGARLVMAGTRSQVGKMRYDPIDENHPEFPTDIYSANKTAAEKYCLIYCTSYGIHTASLRITNLYGPRARVKDAGYGVVNYFIRLALEGRTIQIYKPGNQRRDCLYISDGIRAMLLAGASRESRGEVFNVASGSTLTIYEIANRIVRAAGSGSVTLVPWPKERESIEVGDVSMSIAKAERVLGWKPRVDLDAGLAESVEYLRPRLADYI